MDLSCKMFLLAVEEMNFTRAAKRMYVTQQCLSEHIRSLEKELGTALFYRSPRLALSPSGKALWKALQKQALLEENLRKEIREIDQGQVGRIRLGIYATRARWLLPEVTARFLEQFPQVTLTVTLGDTKEMIQGLLRQELDLILGVDPQPDPRLTWEPAGEEELLFLATLPFLRAHYRGKEPWQDPQWGQMLDLEDFQPFPLLGNQEASTVWQAADRYLAERGIRTTQPIQISDYATQLSLSRKGLAAFFGPSFLLEALRQQNREDPQDSPLLPFRARGLDARLQVCLLWSRDAYQPAYLQAFRKLLKEALEK